jgi:hypothetical protein
MERCEMLTLSSPTRSRARRQCPPLYLEELEKRQLLTGAANLQTALTTAVDAFDAAAAQFRDDVNQIGQTAASLAKDSADAIVAAGYVQQVTDQIAANVAAGKTKDGLGKELNLAQTRLNTINGLIAADQQKLAALQVKETNDSQTKDLDLAEVLKAKTALDEYKKTHKGDP